MAKSVRDLPTDILALIDIREWDMKTPQTRAHFKMRGIRKLPSIAIGGKLVYESLIPDQNELIARILACVNRNQGGCDER
jgi:hypothetical protein